MGEARESEGGKRENSKDLKVAVEAAEEMEAGSGRGVKKTIGEGASSRAETIRETGQKVVEDY